MESSDEDINFIPPKTKIANPKSSEAEQINIVVEENQKNDRSKTRKFQCENCGKSFHSKDNYNLHLTIHMKKIHGNQICKVCTRQFVSIDDLVTHMEEAHKDTKCIVCSRYFVSIVDLLEHIEEAHKDTSNEDGANHQTKKTKPIKKVAAKKFKCLFCVSEFSWKHNLKTHIKKKHENHIDTEHKDIEKNPKIACDENEFENVESFSKNSNEIDIEKNPKIMDDVTQKHEINDTLKGSDDSKKTKKEMFKISNHSRSPSKRRKILPSKFNNKENCNSGGKFQCPYCKSKFSQKHNLKTHVKKKHDEKIGLDTHVQQKHEDKHTKIHDKKQESLHMEKKPFKCTELNGHIP